jgi:hypothetical protein
MKMVRATKTVATSPSTETAVVAKAKAPRKPKTVKSAHAVAMDAARETEEKKVKAMTAKPVVEKASNGSLRKPQVRILQCLFKAGKELTRAQIAVKAPVDPAGCVEWIGSHDPDKRAANDVKHFPSLVTLDFIKQEQHDVDGKDVIVYLLTAKGKAVSAKL